MKIVFDNIIFFLQRSGGISLYWSEILKRASQSKKLQFVCFEPNGKSQNNRDVSLLKLHNMKIDSHRFVVQRALQLLTEAP